MCLLFLGPHSEVTILLSVDSVVMSSDYQYDPNTITYWWTHLVMMISYAQSLLLTIGLFLDIYNSLSTGTAI